MLKIDTSHTYKDVYKVLEVYRVMSVDGSNAGDQEDNDDLDYISLG